MAKQEVFKYNADKQRIRERPRFTKEFKKPSLTKQEFAQECDINVLMKRYQKTGLFPQRPGDVPRYVSNIGAPDFQTALNLVMTAESEFKSLNSELRKRFDNDPYKFYEFVNNPENAEEAIKLGLREKPLQEPGPVRVEVVNPNPPGDDPK